MVALVVFVEPTVTTLPTVPVTVKEVNVFVVPPSNKMVCEIVLVLPKLLNVFEPVIVSVLILPPTPPIVKVLYVRPPPTNVLAVADVFVGDIVEDPALNVRPVVVPKSQIVPVPDSRILLDPSDIDLVLVLLELNELAAKLKLLVTNEPDVTVTILVEPNVMLDASCSVEAPTIKMSVDTIGTLLKV